ncbi:MAG TPA: MFS transporter [Pseudonocardiaceae bacterium]|jgi:predicted MFS family arabinose efflux permease|nr:MFS transporter [Pseudonocardiaceae bacterium]
MMGHTAEPSARSTARWLPVIMLALGTFCAGTDNYLIAGVLSSMAKDLHVSVAGAGQFVTAYSISYAVGAPIVMTVLRVRSARRMLVTAIGLFVVVNVLAAVAQDAAMMAVARVLAGCLGGLYSPLAAATATGMVAADRRGRALAVVLGGTSVATLAGVPIGIWIAHLSSWRGAFLFVALLAVIAAIGVVLTVPNGGATPTVPPRARVAPLRQPSVLLALGVTVAGLGAGFMIYTYLQPLFAAQPAVGGGAVGPLIMVQGAGALLGLWLGSWLVDRYGGRPVLLVSLAVFTVDLALLPLTSRSLVTAFVFVAVWGVVGWAFVPAQQYSLIATERAELAPILLSLNGSAMYIGIAAGSAVGGFVTASFGPDRLWLFATAFAAVGLVLALVRSLQARSNERADDVPAQRDVEHEHR